MTSEPTQGLIQAKHILAGDKLVTSTGSIIAADDAEDSSAMPGLTRIEIEELGTLYTDPESSISITRD